eukprot:2957251-Rhodomonas_salina.5
MRRGSMRSSGERLCVPACLNLAYQSASDTGPGAPRTPATASGSFPPAPDSAKSDRSYHGPGRGWT